MSADSPPMGAPAPLSLFIYETLGTRSLTCLLPFTAHWHILFQPSMYSTHIQSAMTLPLLFPWNFIFSPQIIVTNSYLPSSLFNMFSSLPIPLSPFYLSFPFSLFQAKPTSSVLPKAGRMQWWQSSNFNLSLFTSTQNVVKHNFPSLFLWLCELPFLQRLVLHQRRCF